MTAPSLKVYAQGQGVVSGDNANTFMQTCDTVSQLRSFEGVPGLQVCVRGGAVIGDGNGGFYYWSASATAADNGSTVIKPSGISGAGRWLLMPLATPVLSSTQVSTTLALEIAGDGVMPAGFTLRAGSDFPISVPAGTTSGTLYAFAEVGATSNQSLPINHRSGTSVVQVGSVAFASGGSGGYQNATVTITGGFTWGGAAGEALEVVTPNPSDITLSGIVVVVGGNYAAPGGGTGPVTSVFGRVGAVVAQGGDYRVGDITGAAPLASPAFTGNPGAPTASYGTNSTQIATTAFVQAAIAPLAPLASPTLTGTVTAPHIVGSGTTPSLTPGTGAGSSPAIANTGHDLAGTISVTPGSTPATGATVVTLGFAVDFTATPIANLTPKNPAAAALSGATQVFVTESTSGFTITSGSSALTPGTTYIWNYHVIG